MKVSSPQHSHSPEITEGFIILSSDVFFTMNLHYQPFHSLTAIPLSLEEERCQKIQWIDICCFALSALLAGVLTYIFHVVLYTYHLSC